MKTNNIIIVTIVCLIFFSSLLLTNANAVSDKTSMEVKSRMATNEKIPIIVMLKDKSSFQTLTKENGVSVLKDKSESSQHDIAVLLNNEKKRDNADKIKQFWIVNAIAVNATPQLIELLSTHDDVESIEIDSKLHIIEDYSIQVTQGQLDNATSEIKRINATRAWEIGIDGTGINVSVIDTGIYATHPDISGRVIRWIDYVSSLGSPYDDNGHGTHVAGTVGGNGAGGMTTGVAPNVNLFVAKVLDSTGRGDSSDVISAIEWSVLNKADIISLSLGGGRDLFMKETINNTISAGVTVIAAAGNSGPGAGTISYPAGEKNVIAVGAVDSSDNIASNSSRGPITVEGEELIKPDVSAPGVFIDSLNKNGGYTFNWNGTSMATPHVSGTVALMIQNARIHNMILTPSQIKNILANTSLDLGVAGKDDIYGWGRIDAYNATMYINEPPSVTANPTEYQTFQSAKNGSIITLNVTITDNYGVKNASVNISAINNSLSSINLSNWEGFWKGNLTIDALDGTYLLNVTAYDLSNNINNTTQILVIVDNTPPALTIVLPQNITYNTTSISLNVTANETISTWLYSLNGMTNASFVSPGTTFANTTVPVSTQGLNNINVYARDSAGNWNLSRVNFTLDTFGPVITIASPLNIQYNTTSISLNVSANENASTWLYKLNDAANASLSASNETAANTPMTALEGTNTLIVYANDIQNNWNMSNIVTFSVDSIAPVVTISYPENNSSINIFDRTISGRITDNNNITANLSVGDQRLNWTTKGSFGRIANYSSGLNYINITVTDSYNNTQMSTTIVNVLSVNETTHNIANGTSVNITANESTGVDLVLTAGNNSANVTVSINASINASYFNAGNIANDLGRYVKINVSGDRDNLTSVQLTMFYNHNDLDKNGNDIITDVDDINEDTLDLYWFWDNATGSEVWFPLTENADLSSKIDRSNHSGPKVSGAVERNATANYIRVTLNHFSLYSLSGSLIRPPSNPILPGGGGGGGGGGGSGGASGENYSNIEVTEKYDLAIYKDEVTSYRFTNNNSPIMFVNITGNVSFGEITTSVESLRNISTMVKKDPPGIIYKNSNIWVGSSSFNSPRNIKHGAIRFRVMNSWIKENNIASVIMVKWNKNDWEYLKTNEVSKDDSFTYYDAFAQVFSNFAITGTKDGKTPEKITAIQETRSVMQVKEFAQSATPVKETTKKNPGFGSILAILGILEIYILRRRRKVA